MYPPFLVNCMNIVAPQCQVVSSMVFYLITIFFQPLKKAAAGSFCGSTKWKAARDTASTRWELDEMHQCILEGRMWRENNRQNSVVEKCQSEIKVRAERHNTNYQKIDEEMAQPINSHYNDDVSEQLIKLWTDETRSDENISSQRWTTKQTWLESYEKWFDNQDFI